MRDALKAAPVLLLIVVAAPFAVAMIVGRLAWVLTGDFFTWLETFERSLPRGAE